MHRLQLQAAARRVNTSPGGEAAIPRSNRSLAASASKQYATLRRRLLAPSLGTESAPALEAAIPASSLRVRCLGLHCAQRVQSCCDLAPPCCTAQIACTACVTSSVWTALILGQIQGVATRKGEPTRKNQSVWRTQLPTLLQASGRHPAPRTALQARSYASASMRVVAAWAPASASASICCSATAAMESNAKRPT